MKNKGVLTQEELVEAVEQTDIQFRDKDKGLQALSLCLVDGHSNSHAMSVTGIHRTKIAEAKKIVLQAWRKIVAKRGIAKAI